MKIITPEEWKELTKIDHLEGLQLIGYNREHDSFLFTQDGTSIAISSVTIKHLATVED